MTPEEITKRTAARNAAGELGETVARARPGTVYVDSRGAAGVGVQPPGTAMTAAPKPRGTALATTPQARPDPITSTAKPVPRPQPTITVNSQGVASTLEQRTAQAGAQRMAAERAARINAMRNGGVAGLEQELARQTMGSSPAARPAPAAAPQPSAAVRAGQAVGGAARTAGDIGSRAVRLGAQPAATTPSRIGTTGGAAVTALAALPSAAQSAMTPTEQYNERLGIDPKARPMGAGVRDAVSDAIGLGEDGRRTLENAAEFGRDVGVRTVGALSDFGANILDMGTAVVNSGRALAGAEPIPTFNQILRQNETQRPMGQTPIGQAVDSAAGKVADMIGTTAQPPAAPPPSGGQPQQPAAPGTPPPAGPKVIGQFNGRDITDQQAQELAGRNVVQGAGPAATSAPRAVTSAPDDGQQQLLAMLQQARGDRQGVQSAANERIGKLYDQFDRLMARGKRRSAAIVGEQIRAELGLVGNTTGGQVVDPRRPQPGPEDQANAARTQALTEGVQIDNRAKAQAQQFLQEYLTNPESDAGKQALAKYQAATGSNRSGSDPYTFITQQTLDGESRIFRGNKQTGALDDATPQQARPPVKQDGKTYVWDGKQYVEQQ